VAKKQDAVDQAIDASVQAEMPQRGRVQIALPGNRAAALDVPVPLSAHDVGAIAGVLAEIYHQTNSGRAPTPEEAAAAEARSRIWTPGQRG
jgi:hypothetical protein